MKAVCLIAPDVHPLGGQERVVWELARGLLGRGWTVTIVARTCSLPSHPRLRWVRMRVPTRPSALAYPLFMVTASFATWRLRPPLVYVTGPLILGRSDMVTIHHLLAVAQEKGIVSRSRDTRLYRLNSVVSTFVRLRAEKWCYRPDRAQVFVVHSIGVLRDVAARFPAIQSRVGLVPLGVDHLNLPPATNSARQTVRAELGLDPEAKIALFVGGDWERKGLALALRGVSSSPGWTLVVAGRGARERFNQLAQTASIGQRAIYVGQPVDVGQYFAAADAFVLPSRHEGFSLSTFEAAAAGLPLLVSPVHGVEDIVQDDVNGWLLDDEPSDIPRRLFALNDEGVRRRMGAAARESVASFRWERTVTGYEDLLLNLQPRRL